MTPQAATDADRWQIAKAVAHEYIQSRKHWLEGEYRLELLPEEVSASSSVLVLDAVHEDDLLPQGRGPSRSVQLHINLDQQSVEKELGYQ